jgi:hypothetical protein
LYYTLMILYYATHASPPPHPAHLPQLRGGGGGCVHLALPLTPCSPSMTANDNDNNDYNEHDGKHNNDKDEDGCVGVLHIMRNRGHASGKPSTTEENDMIQWLCLRFGGNQWYSERAPLMPSMIN